MLLVQLFKPLFLVRYLVSLGVNYFSPLSYPKLSLSSKLQYTPLHEYLLKQKQVKHPTGRIEELR